MAMSYKEAVRTDIGFMMVDWQERIDFDRMRRERQAKVREAMNRFDVDLLACWRYENYRYLTSARNHEWPTMVFMWSAVMTREGEPVAWSMDKETAESYMPWMNPENILGELRVVEVEPVAEIWARELKEICKRDGVTPHRIALDASTVPLMNVMAREFPEAEMVNAMQVMSAARMVKTVDELRCLVCAYQLTAAGMETARSLLKVPNMRECEVLGAAYKEMYGFGSEWVQCSNIVCSGDYTYPYRRFTSDKIIHPRDLVIIDIGGRFNGYYGDFTRTFLAGEDVKATAEQRDIYQRAYDSLRRAEKALKPGSTTQDVWEAVGAENVWGGFLGHGIGIGPAEMPTIGWESHLAPVELRPGMVFSIEPYFGKYGLGGVRLEDNFVITENGCAVFGPFPHDSRLCDEKPVGAY